MPGHNRLKRVLTPWLTPMRAARGPLRETGVVRSFLIHLLGLAGFILCFALFDQLFWNAWLRDQIIYNVYDAPLIASLIIASWLVGLELCFLLLAWLTTCFGAGVEAYKTSFGRSLSRWYQFTPWLALLVLGLLLVIQGVEAIDDWYWDQYLDARYGDYYDEHGYDEPMRLIATDRFELLIDIGWYGTLGIFNLVALWWALGTVMVHRNKPTWYASCRWPAVCEGCGYALAGLSDEQDCPECGRPVTSSTKTQRGAYGCKSLRLLWRGLFRPSAVGAAIVTRRPTKQPLRVLLWGLLFTVLSGPAMKLFEDVGSRISEQVNEAYNFNRIDSFGEILEHFFITGLTVGVYAALIGGLLLLGAGTLVATIVRVMGKRNIMPAACYAACYSAGLLPAWVLMIGVQAMVIIPLSRYIRDTGRYDLINFIIVLFFIMHAAILIYLPLHIARITKAARFANV